MRQEILDWTSHGSELIATALGIANVHLDKGPQTFDRWIVRQLNLASHLTSESALLVLAYDRPWDAEMMMRSIAEGTVKLAFIALGTAEERVQRAHDFFHVGMDLLHYADDRKLRDFLSRVDEGDERWRPFREMLLAERVDSHRCNIFET